MTHNNTTKTVILLTVIIIGAIMSGCVEFHDIEEPTTPIVESIIVPTVEPEPTITPTSDIKDGSVNVKIFGGEEWVIGNKNTFWIVGQQVGSHTYELVVKADGEIIFLDRNRQFDNTKKLQLTHAFTTLGTHTISVNVIPVGGNYYQSGYTYDEIICVVSDK